MIIRYPLNCRRDGKKKRKSLGTRVGGFIGASEPATQRTKKTTTANSLNELPIEKIGPGPFQPRRIKINEQQLKELSAVH